MTGPHPGATQDPLSSLIRKKDAPSALITWEIARVLGALCQELGAETNKYLVFYYFTPLESNIDHTQLDNV